jgi:hypothetical protein
METYFSATAIWVQNRQPGQNSSNDAALEASLRLNRLVTYFRYEWVQKTAEELNLDETVYGSSTEFPIQSTTLGAGYDLFHLGPVRILGGGQLAWYHPNSVLSSLYGNNPLAVEAYIRLYTGPM